MGKPLPVIPGWHWSSGNIVSASGSEIYNGRTVVSDFANIRKIEGVLENETQNQCTLPVVGGAC